MVQLAPGDPMLIVKEGLVLQATT